MSDGHMDINSVTKGATSASAIIASMVEEVADLELREAMAPELWSHIKDEMQTGEYAGVEPETWWLVCEGATYAIDEWVKTGVVPTLEGRHE